MTYLYRVSAVDNAAPVANEGQQSAQASATTPASIPSSPKNVAVTINYQSHIGENDTCHYTVSWQYPASHPTGVGVSFNIYKLDYWRTTPLLEANQTSLTLYKEINWPDSNYDDWSRYMIKSVRNGVEGGSATVDVFFDCTPTVFDVTNP
jgi:hypothetical protein